MVGEIVIIVVGNFMVDFELCYMQNGLLVVNFIIVLMFWNFDCVVNEWKDGEVLFFCVFVWCEFVEYVVGFLMKGMCVIVQGCLCQCFYQDCEGNQCIVIELEVDEIGFLFWYVIVQVICVVLIGGGGGGQFCFVQQQQVLEELWFIFGLLISVDVWSILGSFGDDIFF